MFSEQYIRKFIQESHQYFGIKIVCFKISQLHATEKEVKV